MWHNGTIIQLYSSDRALLHLIYKYASGSPNDEKSAELQGPRLAAGPDVAVPESVGAGAGAIDSLSNNAAMAAAAASSKGESVPVPGAGAIRLSSPNNTSKAPAAAESTGGRWIDGEEPALESPIKA